MGAPILLIALCTLVCGVLGLLTMRVRRRRWSLAAFLVFWFFPMGIIMAGYGLCLLLAGASG